MIGWSAGGPRAGGYTLHHPEKVQALVLYAPGYAADSPTDPPAEIPPPGFPMTLQTRAALYNDRWDPFVGCEAQFDPRIREYIWPETMSYDVLGQAWGPPEGVQRVRTGVTWGWNSTTVAGMAVPTLIIVAQFDSLVPATLDLYHDIGTPNRAHMTVPCGSHFLVWENNHEILIRASKDWVRSGAIGGQTYGRFVVDKSLELRALE